MTLETMKTIYKYPLAVMDGLRFFLMKNDNGTYVAKYERGDDGVWRICNSTIPGREQLHAIPNECEIHLWELLLHAATAIPALSEMTTPPWDKSEESPQ